jgi:hypothetical protein
MLNMSPVTLAWYRVQHLLAGVDLARTDPVDLILRHRTGLAAEQVERDAALHLRAHGRIAQRGLDLGDVVAVEEVCAALLSPCA